VIRKAKTKNNEAVAIPMNAAVLAVLDKLEERRNGSLYVFPHMQGEQEGEAIKDVKNSFRTALKRAKIEKFRFHDLRHCCASEIAPDWSAWPVIAHAGRSPWNDWNGSPTDAYSIASSVPGETGRRTSFSIRWRCYRNWRP